MRMLAAAAGRGRLAARDGGLMGDDRGQVAVGEPARRGGLPQCPVGGGAVEGGQLHRPSILARIRDALAAAVSASHSPGVSPMPRNCSSAAVRGVAVRFSAPGGAGG